MDTMFVMSFADEGCNNCTCPLAWAIKKLQFSLTIPLIRIQAQLTIATLIFRLGHLDRALLSAELLLTLRR